MLYCRFQDATSYAPAGSRAVIVSVVPRIQSPPAVPVAEELELAEPDAAGAVVAAGALHAVNNAARPSPVAAIVNRVLMDPLVVRAGRYPARDWGS